MSLFLLQEPWTPPFYVATTPNASPKSDTSTELFPEDTQPIEESDESESDTTESYVAKLQNVPQLKRKSAFIFKNFEGLKPKMESPTSSPIEIPSQDPTLVISSDEELEDSMLQIAEISSSTLEME